MPRVSVGTRSSSPIRTTTPLLEVGKVRPVIEHRLGRWPAGRFIGRLVYGTRRHPNVRFAVPAPAESCPARAPDAAAPRADDEYRRGGAHCRDASAGPSAAVHGAVDAARGL